MGGDYVFIQALGPVFGLANGIARRWQRAVIMCIGYQISDIG